MSAAPADIRRSRAIRPSKRLLALLGDDRLVAEIRRGNEAAFEVVYDRYAAALLSFCRHMLGSRESGEEALQHAFTAAWADLQRNDRPVNLKPWLYAIARNRCLSVLRSRRLETAELDEETPSADGLADEVSRRAELQALLADLHTLPEDQRAALVLSELGDLSHADIASVVGVEERAVKALVFAARSKLIDLRAARETPCAEIREQLATLTGGALRRRVLRRHLDGCPGCRNYRDDVRAQRGMIAVILPVAPTAGLKDAILALAGLGGGSAGGAAAAAGAGAGIAATGGFGGATVAKVAVVVVAASGAATAGDRVLDRPAKPAVRPAPAIVSGAATTRPSETRARIVPASAVEETGRARPGTRRAKPVKMKLKRGRKARSQGRTGRPVATTREPGSRGRRVRARGTPSARKGVKRRKTPVGSAGRPRPRVAPGRKPKRVQPEIRGARRSRAAPVVSARPKATLPAAAAEREARKLAK